MDEDDDIQVYKDDGNALLIAYQSGYYDGKKAAQHPWVDLTEDELVQIGVATGLERAAVEMISSMLKEMNT